MLAAAASEVWITWRRVGVGRDMNVSQKRWCPITVKKALTKVQGVSRADVNFDKRQATVTFDDAKTNVQALTRATKDAGYPSLLSTATK